MYKSSRQRRISTLIRISFVQSFESICEHINSDVGSEVSISECEDKGREVYHIGKFINSTSSVSDIEKPHRRIMRRKGILVLTKEGEKINLYSSINNLENGDSLVIDNDDGFGIFLLIFHLRKMKHKKSSWILNINEWMNELPSLASLLMPALKFSLILIHFIVARIEYPSST